MTLFVAHLHFLDKTKSNMILSPVRQYIEESNLRNRYLVVFRYQAIPCKYIVYIIS